MKLAEKIKCLFEQVNNLLTFKPQLDYDEETKILTSVYINGKSASTTIEIDSNPIEGTWSELEELRSNEELIPGDTYILSDYQTKYMIEGTDTEDSEEVLNVIGTAANYAQFATCKDDIISPSTAVGQVLTIKELPQDYNGPLSLGQEVTIDIFFGCGLYIRFAPRVTVKGIALSYKTVKYPNVPTDTLMNDGNGKPALKPKGVINTEVHDGTPYLNMTAEENPEVPIERISLRAIDEKTFSLEAESLTYVGDSLLYDFNDSEVLSDLGEVIDTRNGFILKRINLERTISVNKDWRVQRYRRYQLFGQELDKFRHILAQENRSPGIYEYGANSFSNGVLIDSTNNYFAKFPYEKSFYLDFTKLSEDPFIEGGPVYPTTGITYPNAGPMLVDTSVDFEDIAFTSKDFFIFPIEDNEKTSITTKFIVDDLVNSVFLTNRATFGDSADISVEVKNSLENSSFMSGLNISSLSSLKKIIVSDRFNILNYSLSGIQGLTSLTPGTLTNYGTVENLFLGTQLNSSINQNVSTSVTIKSGSTISSSMIGCVRSDALVFDGKMSYCLFSLESSAVSTIKGRMYLTAIASEAAPIINVPDAWELDVNTWQINVPGKTEPGFKYLFNLFPQEKINNYNNNRDLVYTRILSNGNTELVTFSTPQ